MMCIAQACHLCVSPAGDPCRQPVLWLLHVAYNSTRSREVGQQHLHMDTTKRTLYKRLGHYIHGGWDGFSLLQVD